MFATVLVREPSPAVTYTTTTESPSDSPCRTSPAQASTSSSGCGAITITRFPGVSVSLPTAGSGDATVMAVTARTSVEARPMHRTLSGWGMARATAEDIFAARDYKRGFATGRTAACGGSVTLGGLNLTFLSIWL